MGTGTGPRPVELAGIGPMSQAAEHRWQRRAVLTRAALGRHCLSLVLQDSREDATGPSGERRAVQSLPKEERPGGQDSSGRPRRMATARAAAVRVCWKRGARAEMRNERLRAHVPRGAASGFQPPRVPGDLSSRPPRCTCFWKERRAERGRGRGRGESLN